MLKLSFKSFYKKRYWLAVLLPVSCVAGIAPTGSPYIFGAEAYGDFLMGNMYSQTVTPAEVPGLKETDFEPIWCVKWSHGGLDGGTLGYTCGGNALGLDSTVTDRKAVYVHEEIGVLGTKEGRPITAISLLDKNEAVLLATKAPNEREMMLLEHGVVYLNRPDQVLPLDLRNWRSWAQKDWNALKMHHDGGFISSTRIGNHAAMWNIYLFLLLLLFGVVDVFRLIFLRR